MKDAIKPENFKLKVSGPFEVLNPLHAVAEGWFYRVGDKLEFCLRAPGPYGMYSYLFEVKSRPKKRRSRG